MGFATIPKSVVAHPKGARDDKEKHSLDDRWHRRGGSRLAGCRQRVQRRKRSRLLAQKSPTDNSQPDNNKKSATVAENYQPYPATVTENYQPYLIGGTINRSNVIDYSAGLVLVDQADETLGATLSALSDVLRTQLNVPAGQGLIVESLRGDGPVRLRG